MPDRKTLLEIGASGPLVGFVGALVFVFLGLWLTGLQPQPVLPAAEVTEDTVQIGTPLIYDILGALLGVPLAAAVHPTALAGWVGLLVTAIQLLPMGQLDGGHVMRAVFGTRGRLLVYPVLVGMIVLGIYANFYGWILLSLVIFLAGPLPAFPLDEVSPLSTKHKVLAALCLLVLVVTFIPVPIAVG